MKAARFEYHRPCDLDDAIATLATTGAKLLSGGQSLGPMLNLRLARPSLLVDVGRLGALRAVEETPDGVTFGAAITHAEFEDAAVPDPTFGLLSAVARGIAYRAVRNRGTIGGSLAHADPAADWPTVLAALGAEVRIEGPKGSRWLSVEDFMTGAFETALHAQEIVTGVVVPRLSKSARWGYSKACRKVGEFAEAMAAVLDDPDRGVYRIAIGATEARLVVFSGEGTPDTLDQRLIEAGLGQDLAAFALRRAVLRRAIETSRGAHLA